MYTHLRHLTTVLVCTSFLSAGLAYGSSTCKPKSALPAASGTIVTISNESALQNAVSSLQDGTTLLLNPGTYNLTNTLYIRKNNVTIRGNGNNCAEVVLAGPGMENKNYGNVPHGIWSDASGLTITNLTIRDVYYHTIIFNPGAQSPKIQSVQLLDSGQQFVKSSPTNYSNGVNGGLVENSYFAYTSAPPTTDHDGGIGYTNGIDVHGGDNWVIRNNRFESFHTPDSSAWWWNPAILMWNGAENTTVEGNAFINVDRAISFGLMDRAEGNDHTGGIIRNNMIYYKSGLFSSTRKNDSDAAIIVWDSPSTKVVHNTILANGNLNKSIEFRFNTAGAEAINNLVDAPIGTRNSGTYANSGNISNATASMFKDPSTGNLHLADTASVVIGNAQPSTYATSDIDGENRNTDSKADPGADELNVSSNPPSIPENVSVKEVATP